MSTEASISRSESQTNSQENTTYTSTRATSTPPANAHAIATAVLNVDPQNSELVLHTHSNNSGNGGSVHDDTARNINNRPTAGLSDQSAQANSNINYFNKTPSHYSSLYFIVGRILQFLYYP